MVLDPWITGFSLDNEVDQRPTVPSCTLRLRSGECTDLLVLFD